MSKRRITLNLSRQRGNELLKTVVEDFNRVQKTFTISERNTIPVLRTYVTMQKSANLLDCRISIHSKDGRASLNPYYTPSVFLSVYLVIFLLVIYFSRVVYSPANAQTIFCLFMFIAVPAFFCICEMNSYKKFWEYFKRITQQLRTDQVYEAEQF